MMVRQYENSINEDFDEEMAAQQEEEDKLQSDMVTSIIDSIGWLIKLHQSKILPMLTQHIIPLLSQMNACTLVPSVRGQAICTMDDIIEHCSPEAQALLPSFTPVILEVLDA